jgi:hypothetical protein
MFNETSEKNLPKLNLEIMQFKFAVANKSKYTKCETYLYDLLINRIEVICLDHLEENAGIYGNGFQRAIVNFTNILRTTFFVQKFRAKLFFTYVLGLNFFWR